MTTTAISIYGYALNPAGKVAQVLAHKVPGKPMTQEFTGKVYRNEREANADVLALNIQTAKERRSFERMMAGELS
jgi:hypothetical protein